MTKIGGIFMVKSTASSKMSHRTAEAIRRKLNNSRKYLEILELRKAARKNPEVREDGRVANYDYTGTKRWYDENGVDEDGFYCDGESATPGEYNRDGWKLDFPHWKQTKRRILYYRDGYDCEGYDINGYRRDGFNWQGVNRAGFNRNGIHTVTQTPLDPDGYNFYGLKAGCSRDGELDADVAFALSYLDGPTQKIRQFAAEQGLSEDNTIAQFELAKKKMPELCERFSTRSTAVRGQTIALLQKDMQAVIDGKSSSEEFWHLHPQWNYESIARLPASQGFLHYLGQQACACDITRTATINQLSKILGVRYPSQILEALKIIRQSIPAPAKNTSGLTPRQLYRWQDYVKKFCNGRLENLDGLKVSLDGGKSFISITTSDIERAKAQIYQRGEIICLLTVKEEILKNYQAA